MQKITWPAVKKKIFQNGEKLFFLGMIAVILLATYKYASHGETYLYEVPNDEDRVELVELNDAVISQDLLIDGNAVWNSDSYAVYLDVDGEVTEGTIRATISEEGGGAGYMGNPTGLCENGVACLKKTGLL